MKRRIRIVGLVGLATVVVLAACGGGGGDSGQPAAVSEFAAATSSSFSPTAAVAKANTAQAVGVRWTYAVNNGQPVSVRYGSVVLNATLAAADAYSPKVGIRNTATAAGSLDVYLTGDNDLLSASTPVATAITGGSQSSYAAVVSGTYRLRVTATNNTNDVRLDVHGVTLGSTEVDTIVLSAGAGGLLVNASQVVQGGSVTAYNNNQARVRVVSALTGAGDRNSVTVNGTPIVVNAPSPAISAYTLVNAGSAAITGTVTGTQALAAGSDTTLMVLGTAAVPTLAVIADDNRVPTSTTGVKLRLVNAMDPTTMAAYPLTMALDYSAVASNVTPGAQSAYALLPSTTTSILEVSSALQAATMYSPTNGLNTLTLSAQSVYTVFMFGTATPGQWSGSLRKER